MQNRGTHIKVGLSREEKARRRTLSVWREIDKSCVVGNTRYLVTVKSGPATINDTQVDAMKDAIASHDETWLSQTKNNNPNVEKLHVVIGRIFPILQYIVETVLIVLEMLVSKYHRCKLILCGNSRLQQEGETMTSFTGAVILTDQKKTLLFKNRDLPLERKDEIYYDAEFFGVRGINAITGEVSGCAIGVNKNGLAVGSTRVLRTKDPNYDLLTEHILTFAKDAEEGLQVIMDERKKGKCWQWGNLILADHDSVLVVELAGDDHSVEWSERKVIRAGHHIMLSTEKEVRKHLTEAGLTIYENSMRRVERGYELVRDATNVTAIFSMLKDHDGSPGQSSICLHGLREGQDNTEKSYVVEVDNSSGHDQPKITFHVAAGNPCSTPYNAVPIAFPASDEVIKRAFEIYFK